MNKFLKVLSNKNDKRVLMKFILPIFMLTLTLSASAKSLKIMQYNAENLFDTEHDEGTEDYTYLPLNIKNGIPGFHEICQKMGSEFYISECLNLDWNDNIVLKKTTNIAKVLKSYDSSGNGPDIVVFQEVENKNVLNKLVTKALTRMGYNYQVLIEGDDSRGIDVALISKFPVQSATRHSLIVNGQRIDTRGILEVKLNVDGNDVVIFGNHWPSQSNPTLHRVESAKLLASLADRTQADLIVAMGDFNSIPSESPAPLTFLSQFVDAEKEARKILPRLNPGTHFYKGEWTLLDRIFIHKKSVLKAQFDKFQIINRPFMLKRDTRSPEMVPNRFDPRTGEGFSDHLPMAIEFNY